MQSCLRTVIDFATGDNWETPLALYEKYDKACVQLQLKVPSGHTCIQHWLSTLTEEEKAMIERR